MGEGGPLGGGGGAPLLGPGGGVLVFGGIPPRMLMATCGGSVSVVDGDEMGWGDIPPAAAG